MKTHLGQQQQQPPLQPEHRSSTIHYFQFSVCECGCLSFRSARTFISTVSPSRLLQRSPSAVCSTAAADVRRRAKKGEHFCNAVITCARLPFPILFTAARDWKVCDRNRKVTSKIVASFRRRVSSALSIIFFTTHTLYTTGDWQWIKIFKCHSVDNIIHRYPLFLKAVVYGLISPNNLIAYSVFVFLLHRTTSLLTQQDTE